ncbi:hypothetical protein Tco_0592963 [Tanacetum coccineum]
MSSITAQQTKLDLELVPKEKSLEIEKCNGRLNTGKKQREPTFQVVLVALALTLCYFAFLTTADVPEVYMHQFRDSIHKYDTSYRFRMDKKKKFDLNLEIFRDIFQICPRVHGQNFDEPPTDDVIVSFFKELGHTGDIKSITDVVVDQMHQPWRTFATIINRSLSGKTIGLDKLRLSRAQILCVSPEEPTRKSKRVKRPAKKSTNAPTTGVVIRDTPVMSLSKKKEKMIVEKHKGINFLSEVALTKEAQYEEVRKKSLRDFHKTHPSGSGIVTSAAKIKPSITNEGTGCHTLKILVESVGSWFPRVIHISSISVEVLVAPEVGTAAVASPTGVLELDTHSSSEADLPESTPPPVSVAPMVSPFLWRSSVAPRSSSPTTSTLEIHTSPILPVPSPIVAPSSKFPLAPVVAPPGIRRQRAILIRPGEDIPIGRLYHTHPGGPYRALTARKSVRPLPSHRLALRYTSHHLDRFIFGSSSSHSSLDHSSSGHSILGHSLFGHTSPDTTVADSSTPPRFVHPSLARTQWCSEAYLRWRSATLSTMYPPMTSESSASDSSSESSAGPSRKRCRSPATTVISSIHATRALVPSHADLLPPRKRFRDSISPKDSVEEDTNTNVLEDIEADATDVEVAVYRDVVIRIGVGIDMEVKVESSDRGTMEVGVDVTAGIDIPDAMLMLDAVERLENVEEGLQDIYDHVIEIPLQRIEDIETGQRELEARSLIAGGERASLLDQVASLERSNARL